MNRRTAFWPALVLALAVTFGVHLLMFPGSVPDFVRASGGGTLLDAKPAFSEDALYQRLEAYGEQGRGNYRLRNLTVDLLLPLSGTRPRTRSPNPTRRVCGCVSAALNRLPGKSREIVEAVELRGMTPSAYGKAHAISAGNAAVRLHRARRLLADRLKDICGTCTLDGCADCDCGHPGVTGL